MSGGGQDDAEKSHEPTQRKLEKARERGEVPKSTDLTTAAGYAGFLLALIVTGTASITNLGSGLMALIDRADMMAPIVFSGAAGAALGGLLAQTSIALIPWFLFPALAVILMIAAQRSFVVAPDRVKPKLSRVSILSNAKNKFGRGGLFEFAKSFVKLTLFSACLAYFLATRLEEMAGSALASPSIGMTILARLAVDFFFVVLIIAGSVGTIDFLWQRAEHIRKNRMSDREIRDEMKDAEGDPHMKGERRQRAQEIALNQMMAEVPKADVVIVNPTHYAVALKWDRTPGAAPVLVAKGVDEVAHRIREVAIQSSVPIHRDPPTARLLWDRTDIGMEIAPGQYRAVAAAIRFADMVRRKAKQRGW